MQETISVLWNVRERGEQRRSYGVSRGMFLDVLSIAFARAQEKLQQQRLGHEKHMVSPDGTGLLVHLQEVVHLAFLSNVCAALMHIPGVPLGTLLTRLQFTC